MATDLLQSPAPLVIVAMSVKLFRTIQELAGKHHNMKEEISTLQEKISDVFWSSPFFILSRARQRGLQYVVQGYIQNIKIKTEGDTTVFEEKLTIRNQRIRNPIN